MIYVYVCVCKCITRLSKSVHFILEKGDKTDGEIWIIRMISFFPSLSEAFRCIHFILMHNPFSFFLQKPQRKNQE